MIHVCILLYRLCYFSGVIIIILINFYSAKILGDPSSEVNHLTCAKTDIQEQLLTLQSDAY